MNTAELLMIGAITLGVFWILSVFVFITFLIKDVIEDDDELM